MKEHVSMKADTYNVTKREVLLFFDDAIVQTSWLLNRIQRKQDSIFIHADTIDFLKVPRVLWFSSTCTSERLPKSAWKIYALNMNCTPFEQPEQSLLCLEHHREYCRRPQFESKKTLFLKMRNKPRSCCIKWVFYISVCMLLFFSGFSQRRSASSFQKATSSDNLASTCGWTATYKANSGKAPTNPLAKADVPAVLQLTTLTFMVLWCPMEKLVCLHKETSALPLSNPSCILCNCNFWGGKTGLTHVRHDIAIKKLVLREFVWNPRGQAKHGVLTKVDLHLM